MSGTGPPEGPPALKGGGDGGESGGGGGGDGGVGVLGAGGGVLGAGGGVLGAGGGPVVSWATREAVMGRGSCLVSPTTSQANRSVSAATTTRMPSATFSILVMTAPPSMLLLSGYRQTSLDASRRRSYVLEDLSQERAVAELWGAWAMLIYKEVALI
jgi:hypothetical protein